ncbi:MAG: prepilin-type N-terminal cleavage/methylation domain-containing protein [Phycisphaeraceae bacterium]
MMKLANVKRRSGFSLVELVIVVAIIAIIGAIAIPRMSRGAAGAADSALIGDLAVLRNAIELYAAEHNGDFPDAATFEAQLTEFTDADGATSATKDATHIYGPYIRRIPPLPVGTNRTETGIADASTDTIGDAGAGWFYDAAAGTIRANLADAEDDATERAYNAY